MIIDFVDYRKLYITGLTHPNHGGLRTPPILYRPYGAKTPYTLHPKLYSLHPKLYSLHSTLYTISQFPDRDKTDEDSQQEAANHLRQTMLTKDDTAGAHQSGNEEHDAQPEYRIEVEDD